MRRRSVRARRVADAAVKVVAWLGAAFGVGVMAWILAAVIHRGAGAIGWDFFTDVAPGPGGRGGGLGPAIVGTLLLTIAAAVVGIPLGFLAAVYLSEFGKNGRFATALRLTANVMMGVPSILVGVFIWIVLVVPLKHYSGYAGAAALAFIMLPVMARTGEDILAMVPNELRESALALGAPRWKTTLGVVCRAARGGLLTGALLAVVRVSGETAPLLFTAANSPYWISGRSGLSQPTANLTVTVYNFATSPYSNWNRLAWGGALMIIIGVLGMNVIARLVLQRGKGW